MHKSCSARCNNCFCFCGDMINGTNAHNMGALCASLHTLQHLNASKPLPGRQHRYYRCHMPRRPLLYWLIESVQSALVSKLVSVSVCALMIDKASLCSSAKAVYDQAQTTAVVLHAIKQGNSDCDCLSIKEPVNPKVHDTHLLFSITNCRACVKRKSMLCGTAEPIH